MKKLLALLLCCTFLFCTAQAAGLPQLGGGGLPQINAVPAGDPGVLPDPAELLDSAGEVFARDYAYAPGYSCTVYLYDQPADPQAFLSDYCARAEANGFQLESTAVEGFDALILRCEGKYAMLFPEYSGVIMLMVEDGMVFGEPRPEGSYISFSRNGRSMTGSAELVSGVIEGGLQLNAQFEAQPIRRMSLSFPDYAAPGDVFVVTSEDQAPWEFALFTDADGFLVSSGGTLQYSQDYFFLEIAAASRENEVLKIEGHFEGSFDHGKTIIEDGTFYAEMPC